MFEVPAAMQGKRVLLHFGAVGLSSLGMGEWKAKLVTHIGGSVSFAFRYHSVLHDGKNELVVRAFDDTTSGKQPTGKQTHSVSEGLRLHQDHRYLAARRA